MKNTFSSFMLFNTHFLTLRSHLIYIFPQQTDFTTRLKNRNLVCDIYKLLKTTRPMKKKSTLFYRSLANAFVIGITLYIF